MNEQEADRPKKESPIGLAMEDINKSLDSLKETTEELTFRTTQIRNSIPSTKDPDEGADTPSPQPSSTLTTKLKDFSEMIDAQTARLAKILSELDI